MAAHVFELLFHPPQTKPHLGPARSHIALSFYSRGKDDRIHLWGECVTVAEVEGAAEALKEDLDRIVAEARRKFPKSQGGRPMRLRDRDIPEQSPFRVAQ